MSCWKEDGWKRRQKATLSRSGAETDPHDSSPTFDSKPAKIWSIKWFQHSLFSSIRIKKIKNIALPLSKIIYEFLAF